MDEITSTKLKQKGYAMADIKNTSNTTKEYATDELGMMADAKDYASKDWKTCEALYAKMLNVETLTQESKDSLAKNLIEVKYEQIKNARCNRVSYFD